MPKTSSIPNRERMCLLFNYDENTGKLHWAPVQETSRGSHRRKAGEEAGYLIKPRIAKNKPYIRVTIDGVRYMAHTVIWFMMTGEWLPRHLDHDDGDGTNNRLNNLRRCTASLNNANQKRRSDSATGVKGVKFKGDVPRSRPYVVVCKRRHIGYFATIAEANSAYREAAEKMFGEFASTDR